MLPATCYLLLPATCYLLLTLLFATYFCYLLTCCAPFLTCYPLLAQAAIVADAARRRVLEADEAACDSALREAVAALLLLGGASATQAEAEAGAEAEEGAEAEAGA